MKRLLCSSMPQNLCVKRGDILTKKEIIRRFRRMPDFERKKYFMETNGIKYHINRYNNVTVFAEDGTLRLFPIK